MHDVTHQASSTPAPDGLWDVALQPDMSRALDRRGVDELLRVGLSIEQLDTWLDDLPAQLHGLPEKLRTLVPAGADHATRVSAALELLERHGALVPALHRLLRTAGGFVDQLRTLLQASGSSLLVPVAPSVPASLLDRAAETLETWGGGAGDVLREGLATKLRLPILTTAPSWREAILPLSPNDLERLLQAVRERTRNAAQQGALDDVLAKLDPAYDLRITDVALAAEAGEVLRACVRMLDDNHLEHALADLEALERRLGTLLDDRLVPAEPLLAARARVGVHRANALLGLQRVDEAAALVGGLEPGLLPTRDRLVAAQISLLTLHPEHVERLLEGLGAEDRAPVDRLRAVMEGAPVTDDDPDEVRSAAATAWMEREDWATCASEAPRLMLTGDLLLRLRALGMLVFALQGTVSSLSGTPIPVDQRREVVRRARALLDELRHEALPSVLEERVLLAGLVLALNESRRGLSRDLAARLAEIAPERPELRQAEERWRQLDDGVLPSPQGHQWLDQLNEGFHALRAGDTVAAGAIAAALTQEHPEYGLGHHLAAVVYLQTGDSLHAMEAARRAAVLAPVFVVDLHHADLLARAGSAAEGWAIASVLPDEGDWRIAEVLATIATHASAPESPARWRRVVELVGPDRSGRARALLNLACACFRLASYQEAYAASLDALRGGGLSPDDLGLVFFYARNAGTAPGRLMELARDLLDRARTDWPEDLRTEALTHRLNEQLAFPELLPRPDYRRLAEGGLARTVPADELVELLRTGARRLDGAGRLYAERMIDARAFAEQAGWTLTKVAHWMLNAGSAPLPVAAPRFQVPSLFTEMWLGALELLLLSGLDLLDEMDLRGVTWVMPQVDHDTLVNEVAAAVRDHQEVAFIRQGELLRLVQGPPFALRTGPVAEADLQLASRERWTVVSHAQGAAWSPRALARWLGERRPEDERRVRAALPDLSGSDGVGAPPSDLMLDSVTLQEFALHELLELLVGCAAEHQITLHVGPEAWDDLQRRLQELEREGQRRDLVQGAHRWLGRQRAEGRLNLIGGSAVAAAGFQAAIERALLRIGWAHAVPGRVVVGADAWGAGEGVLRLLFLRSHLRDVGGIDWDRLRAALPQALELPVLTLPSLLRLLPASRGRDDALRRLGRLGAVDALDGDRLMRFLVERGVVTTHLLAEYGWSARTLDSADPHGRLAIELWVGSSVNRSLVRAWDLHEDPPCTRTDAPGFTTSLLDALGRLGDEVPWVDVGRCGLTAAVEVAWQGWARGVRRLDGNQFTIAEASPIIDLWRAIAAWSTALGATGPDAAGTPVPGAGEHGQLRWDRRAMMLVAEILEQLLRAFVTPDDPSGPRTQHPALGAPIVQLTQALPPVYVQYIHELIGVLEVDSPVLASIRTILPGPHGPRPWSPEQLFQQAARHWAERWDGIQLAGVWLSFPIYPGMSFSVPIEAAWLRLPADVQVREASTLLHVLGVLDHRLVAVALAESPRDRQQLSLVAARSPWRTVALDPLSLVRWGSPLASITAPRSLAELRALLGEPEAGPPSLATFLERIRGPWAARPDLPRLLEHLQQVIGDCGLAAAWTLFREDDPEPLVARAWSALQRPEDLPAALLGAHLLTLRLAAEARDTWIVGAMQVDLRAQLANLAAELLQHTAPDLLPSEPTPQALSGVLPGRRSETRNLASWEGPILRLCRSAAAQVAGGDLTPGELVWLTHRLYAWLMELVGNDPDTWAALEGPLRRLDAVGQQVPPVGDGLDPNHIRRDGLRLRTLAVLHGLFTGELTRGEVMPRVLYSPRLVTVLHTLTTCPTPTLPATTALPWDFPIQVADAALLVLTSIHPDALSQASEEAQLRWVERLRDTVTPGTVRDLLEAAIIAVLARASEPTRRAILEVASARPLDDLFALQVQMMLHENGAEVPAVEVAARFNTMLLDADHRVKVIRMVLLLASAQGAEAVALTASALRVALVEIGVSSDPVHAGLAALLRHGDPAIEQVVRDAVMLLKQIPGLSEDPTFFQVLERA
jgi:tetratricopeptide (TPR) repeat protein